MLKKILFIRTCATQDKNSIYRKIAASRMHIFQESIAACMCIKRNILVLFLTYYVYSKFIWYV